MSTIIDIIKFLCKQKGITIKELEVQTGLSNGTIGKWSNCSPKTDSLTKIADYLGVSIDYLLGRSASPEIHNPVFKTVHETQTTHNFNCKSKLTQNN